MSQPPNRGKNSPQQNSDFMAMSDGLSKAAQAAKYLDGSDSKKEAIELMTKKEQTKQLELEENKV